MSTYSQNMPILDQKYDWVLIVLSTCSKNEENIALKAICR